MKGTSPHSTLMESSTITPRSYQLEMLAESMDSNSIVAMPTGSGKTHVAILRIQEELKRCQPDQIAWFLAPNVALVEQQHLCLKAHLSAYQHLFLCGADGVDKWSTQRLWDAVLKNVRIVCSTPQVLYDALYHGFVKLARIAILVIDEAHGTRSNSSTSKIMSDYYQITHARPHILGLTASPVMKSKPSDLANLETNLHSRVKTPKIYRSDLMTHTNQPLARAVTYFEGPNDSTLILDRLADALSTYDILQDPFIRELKVSERQSDKIELEKKLTKRETWCLKQLQGMLRRACDIAAHISSSLADRFVQACVKRLRNSTTGDSNISINWASQERQHLLSILEDVTAGVQNLQDSDVSELSGKARQLVETLSSLPQDKLVGLLFAKQRATVWALTEMLRKHKQTQHLRIAPFVGNSLSINRKTEISDLADLESQQRSLQDFRESKVDLIVSTDVLSEGIDVPSANVVICFDQPENLVSFVQKRGRARARESQYILLTPSPAPPSSDWVDLEKAMVEAYLEDERQAQAMHEAEALEEHVGRQFRVKWTQALLTFGNATAHLHHFCQSIGGIGPTFTILECEGGQYRTAQVILPITVVDHSLRTTSSKHPWRTEKAAKRDAAFEAYVRLYNAGLVNDNLLPLLGQELDEELHEESKPQLCTVSDRFNPWKTVSRLWHAREPVQTVPLSLWHGNELVVQSSMIFPRVQPISVKIPLYWDETKEYAVIVHAASQGTPNAQYLLKAKEATHIILDSVFSSRMKRDVSDFIVLFVPQEGLSDGCRDLHNWNTAVRGSSRASEHLIEDEAGMHPAMTKDFGLVQHSGGPNAPPSGPYLFKTIGHAVPRYEGVSIDGNGSDVQSRVLCVEATKFPKRRDFLHPLKSGNPQCKNVSYTKAYNFPVSDCKFDNLPARYSVLALMMPSILHVQEITLVADELRSTLLAPLEIKNLDFVLTAICASSANEKSDYQRQEFLGDCVLKFITSLHIMVAHPLWSESYLTRMKSRLVSNSTLATAAMRVGLDRFIITKPFTGAKWRPIYTDEQTEADQSESRQLSSKILADVVEALIGTAYLDGAAKNEGTAPWNEGGLEKAIKCLQIFCPEVSWLPYSEMRTKLYSVNHVSGSADSISTNISEPERILHHTFTCKPLLASALTHSSYNLASHHTVTDNSALQCYQRLEFLGDALLDLIVTTKLFSHDPPLPHHTMHTYRTACVSGDILAFLSMQHTLPITRNKVVTTVKRPATAARSPEYAFTSHATEETTALWHYMQHDHSPSMMRQQSNVAAMYAKHSDSIAKSLTEGERYPWATLGRLQAPKFMSDLVESCLAAVWIDSGCKIDDCMTFVEGLGITKVLRRLVGGDLWALHPKEEIGMLVGKMPCGIGGVKYETRRMTDEAKLECSLSVGEVGIANVGEGKSNFEVETMAAEEAVLMWHDVGGPKERLESALKNKIDVDEEKDETVVYKSPGSQGDADSGDDADGDDSCFRLEDTAMDESIG